MTKQDIASILCKILGIYMIIQGINVMANVIPAYFLVPQQGLGINQRPLLLTIFPFLFLIIFGLLLWPLSDKLAVIMVKRESRFNEETGIKASDMQRISFSVLGLLLLGNSIPKLVSDLITFNMMRGVPNPAVMLFGQLGMAGLITQFIIGLGIFLGSQGLVNFLYAIRNIGVSKDHDFND